MPVDPFDIAWIDEDPLGRQIVHLKSVASAREKAGKHTGAEHLPEDDIRSVVTDPDRIDLTTKSPRHREIYYRVSHGRSHPYSRVVVDFDEDRGCPISWSRYERPVSYMQRVYERDEGAGEDLRDRP